MLPWETKNKLEEKKIGSCSILWKVNNHVCQPELLEKYDALAIFGIACDYKYQVTTRWVKDAPVAS